MTEGLLKGNTAFYMLGLAQLWVISVNFTAWNASSEHDIWSQAFIITFPQTRNTVDIEEFYSLNAALPHFII